MQTVQTVQTIDNPDKDTRHYLFNQTLPKADQNAPRVTLPFQKVLRKALIVITPANQYGVG
ncbi:hypothetical protein D5071_10030 [Pectobacterium carotovorum]|uniref:Uncharacterized protein n=1 Tax=Pectobacterium carotovorum TaxID=554 RepID=A0A419AWY8_PECCA|nr:hypothetical protein D5071_10030 [Pectobacterium carotovorum]